MLLERSVSLWRQKVRYYAKAAREAYKEGNKVHEDASGESAY